MAVMPSQQVFQAGWRALQVLDMHLPKKEGEEAGKLKPFTRRSAVRAPTATHGILFLPCNFFFLLLPVGMWRSGDWPGWGWLFAAVSLLALAVSRPRSPSPDRRKPAAPNPPLTTTPLNKPALTLPATPSVHRHHNGPHPLSITPLPRIGMRASRRVFGYPAREE